MRRRRAAPRIAAAPFALAAGAVVLAAVFATGEPLPAPGVVFLPGTADLPLPASHGGYAGMRPDPLATAVGVASCATVSCHGGPKAGNHDVQSFAFTIWMNDDPHARAYETLHSPRSKRMAQLLRIGEAHRAAECLACHSMQHVSRPALPPEVLADGVGCSSCHGESSRWQHLHHLPEWKHFSAPQREALGFRDLGSVAGRANACIACHVGNGSQQVDHDLVAAGHPRLAFEFSAYQRLWPRHWTPVGKLESRPDFTERSWAVGQATTLAAVADLLAVRTQQASAAMAAGRPHRWPEFSEFDCYACHKSLGPSSYAAAHTGGFRNPFPGQPSWQPWYVSAGRLLDAAAAPAVAPGTRSVGMSAVDVRRVLEADWSVADRARLERMLLEARGLQRAALQAGREIETRDHVVLHLSQRKLDALVANAPPEWRFWDAAVQTLLAMEAAEGGAARLGVRGSDRAGGAAGDTRRALDELRESLRFPPGADTPEGFSPVRFNRDRVAVPFPSTVQP
ncbi:MAG: multiheme c-type cytochrome [Planctomycetia bacterium]